MIIAGAALTGWRASDWSETTKALLPNGIDLPAAALLASGDTTRFDPESARSGESAFRLTPTDSVPANIYDIDLDEEQVIIKVNPETYLQIAQAQANNRIEATLWPSLYHSAVMQALRHHRQEAYAHRRWAGNIARKLAEALGREPDDDEIETRDFYYAQIIMDHPLGRMLDLFEADATEAE